MDTETRQAQRCCDRSETGEAKEKWPMFKDLGGMNNVLQELKFLLRPFLQPEVVQWGFTPAVGILLHGPSGSGKTSLARAIGKEIDVPFYEISGLSGVSIENLTDLFSKALSSAPSIVFIDDIDAIAFKEENLRLRTDMDRRILAHLRICMNKISDSNSKASVLVVGATNKLDTIDSSLRVADCFTHEIEISFPNENARLEIFYIMTQKLSLEATFNLLKVAKETPGYVGLDLTILVDKAVDIAVRKISDQRKPDLSSMVVDEEHWWKECCSLDEITNLAIITMADFEEAIKMVQPCLTKEWFFAIPNEKWEDVGGLEQLKTTLKSRVVEPIKYPEDYQAFGVKLGGVLLLYGPPGCGKTLIAKAAANEAGANFIHVEVHDLLNRNDGESLLAVRTLFRCARACSPCVLFFDDVDALTTKQGKRGEEEFVRLLQSQLCVELDEVEQPGVFVIGATNRLEVMDRAMLRPGRFGHVLYVPMPNPNERGLILKAHGRKRPIDASVDLVAFGQREACENFSGADLLALMNEAAKAALNEKWASSGSDLDSTPPTIKIIHFESGLAKVSPSLSKKEIESYEKVASCHHQDTS